MKITIIGIGKVGSTIAFGLILNNIEQLSLIDNDVSRLDSEC